jgi:hypothetical protein
MVTRFSLTSSRVECAATYSSISLERDKSRKFNTCCYLAMKMANSGLGIFIFLTSEGKVCLGTSVLPSRNLESKALFNIDMTKAFQMRKFDLVSFLTMGCSAGILTGVRLAEAIAVF